MACSSRNPQNCLAGANDYRIGRHPVPDDRREDHGRRLARLVHDERRRPHLAHAAAAGLSAGYLCHRACVAAQGLSGRRRSDHPPGHQRPLLLRRAGVRSRGGRRQRHLRRALHRQQQPGRDRGRTDRLSGRLRSSTASGPPRSWLSAGPRRSPGRVSRGATVRQRETATAADQSRQSRRRAARRTTQMVDKPWIAVDVPRAGAAMCTIGGPGTGRAPCRRFPGGRVYMAYALFDGPGEARGRIMFSRSTDCGRRLEPASHPQPHPERRRE